MERIAVKFGGSSVADGAQLRKVKAILEADVRRKVIVVSAPGKRSDNETKLTDLLYLCHDMAVMNVAVDEPFGKIKDRFVEIVEDLGCGAHVLTAIDNFRDELINGCSRDYAASRGEYFSALVVADFLDAEFIDPADFLVIRENGTVDPVGYSLLGARMAENDNRYVMAGFYGRDTEGRIKTFSRGGSDISGAIAARAAGAVLYENWTDTSGILMADPRIVENPRRIEEISFREIREMSYMGASVFHDEAILPVREAGIPIRICNTNRPEDPGTVITIQLSAHIIANTEIAGIAGRRNFSIISLEKTLMNREKGFIHRLISLLWDHGVAFEHCPSSIDTVSVITESSAIEGLEEVIRSSIGRQLEPDQISIEKNLALIAVVGEGMVRTVGIAGKIFSALGRAGVNVRVINQGASEMNIIVGVAEDDYERAIRTIYAAFVA